MALAQDPNTGIRSRDASTRGAPDTGGVRTSRSGSYCKAKETSRHETAEPRDAKVGQNYPEQQQIVVGRNEYDTEPSVALSYGNRTACYFLGCTRFLPVARSILVMVEV